MARTAEMSTDTSAHGKPNVPRVIRRGSLYVVAVFVLATTGVPFIFMVMTAFKRPDEFLINLWGLPQGVYIDNFVDVFTGGIGRFFFNSIVVSFISVALILIVGSLASYAFAKMKFRFNNPLLLLFLMGAMIPVHVTLIPVFILTLNLGLYDTIWALVGPYVGFNLPVSIFILTEFFRQIPDEIEEAARMDGASRLSIFLRITLPMSVPALVTVGIFSLIHIWNEFAFALVLISEPSQQTLPLGLTRFYQEFSINVPGVMAALTLACLPVMVLYLFAQERVISGLMAGAVKG